MEDNKAVKIDTDYNPDSLFLLKADWIIMK